MFYFAGNLVEGQAIQEKLHRGGGAVENCGAGLASTGFQLGRYLDLASALHLDPSQREEEHPAAAGHAEVLPVARHALDHSEKYKGDEERDGDAALGDYFRGNDVSQKNPSVPFFKAALQVS